MAQASHQHTHIPHTKDYIYSPLISGEEALVLAGGAQCPWFCEGCSWCTASCYRVVRGAVSFFVQECITWIHWLKLGITNSWPGQWLLPICHWILWDDHHICPTHLSLCPPSIPPSINCAEPVWTTCQPSGKSCSGSTNLMGAKYCKQKIP